MTISIVECLLKNIYICTVYTIFADYIFPCKWFVCQHYGLQKKWLCVLEIVFLGTFDKIATVHDTSRHNPTLTWLLRYLQYVIYFCIAENIFRWSVYWFIWTEHLQNVGLKQRIFKTLITLLYVHSCYVLFPESYYGLQNLSTSLLWYNKRLIKHILCLFHSAMHKMFLKLRRV